MADIFISYASNDRDRVIPIVNALVEQGWSTFWDWRSIPVGKTWRQFIKEGLGKARCVLVIWSESSIDSEWVIEEADHGKTNRMLVPVRIDDVRPPMGFGQIQAANFINWTGDKNTQEFKKLANAIESILNQSKGHVNKAERVGEKRTLKEAEQVRKAQFVKIGVLIAMVLVIVVGAIFYLRKEPEVPTSNTNATAPPVKIEQQTATKPNETSPQKLFTNSLGMEFVLIPAGSFKMGSGISPKEVVRRYGGDVREFIDEHPQHSVEITKPFYLQATEVTQGQWQKVMGDNPSVHKDCGEGCPVENVSWDEAKKFIKKLNDMEATDKYRLPTEAEWEYSCRAGTTTEFSFGDDVGQLGEYAWFKKNSGSEAHPVGRKKPNSWGLYGMHGNVVEWLEDDWHDNYDGAPTNGLPWIDESRGFNRVVRGGSWDRSAGYCRSAVRRLNAPHKRYTLIGFRLAMSVAVGP